VDQLDARGQHVLDAVTVNGVRVAAAHFHELEVVAFGQFLDPSDQSAGGSRVAIFVDETH
jgi:hypothetical protein